MVLSQVAVPIIARLFSLCVFISQIVLRYSLFNKEFNNSIIITFIILATVCFD